MRVEYRRIENMQKYISDKNLSFPTVKVSLLWNYVHIYPVQKHKICASDQWLMLTPIPLVWLFCAMCIFFSIEPVPTHSDFFIHVFDTVSWYYPFHELTQLMHCTVCTLHAALSNKVDFRSVHKMHDAGRPPRSEWPIFPLTTECGLPHVFSPSKFGL